MKLIVILPIVSVLFVTQIAIGMFERPESVPVARLLSQAAAVVKREPKNAEAHYTLARIRYLAFVCATEKLHAYPPLEDRPLPTIEPFRKFTSPNPSALDDESNRRALAELNLKESPSFLSPLGKQFLERSVAIGREMEKSGWRPADLADAKATEHIAQAIDQFHIAHRLSPENALYRLGYASLLEQAAAWAKRHPHAEAPEIVRKITPAAIREEYRKVWEMELSADLKDRDRRGMMSPWDMVSFEAGEAFVRLAEANGASLSAEEKKTLASVHTSLVELRKGTKHGVTPIVFSTEPVRTLDALLALETIVDFPLRGWGPHRRWPWVKADTALLVWNPSRSGRIASGAQLFGSYTWELFWKTGYEPLAVLDADGDGELRGPELDGLAAWFDHNGDGVSDPGEVQPLCEMGVTVLATRATGMEGRHPVSARGITFSDGRVLPTWDWMVEPVDATPMLSRRNDRAGGFARKSFAIHTATK